MPTPSRAPADLEPAAHRPALIVGIATVAAPVFVRQPAMGAGVAARRTPRRPGVARVDSLLTHGIFGLKLYAAAGVASLLER